jgi:hypothetical protein
MPVQMVLILKSYPLLKSLVSFLPAIKPKVRAWDVQFPGQMLTVLLL